MQFMRWAMVAAGFLVVTASAADDRDETKFAKEEQLLVDLTNKARAKEKLPPLKVNALLVKAARGHSTNMAKQQKLSHELDGKRSGDRIDAVKYDWEQCGENVGRYDKAELIERMFDEWMKSPEHRKNILAKEFEEIGIGIAPDARTGTWYATQNFGTQNK